MAKKTDLPNGEITLETLDKVFGKGVLNGLFLDACDRRDIDPDDLVDIFDPIDVDDDRKNFFDKQNLWIEDGKLMSEGYTSNYVWDGGAWVEDEDEDSDDE